MKFFLICVSLCAFLAVNADETINPFRNQEAVEDAKLNMVQLVQKHGYPIEEHKVTTEDGYILTIYRIPTGNHCGNEKTKKPIILAHGLFSSSYDYVGGGPKASLAYLLANRCHDVWITNNRGNSVSREHVNLTTSNPKFWDFSWHEMGVYDIPAMIDHILDVTNETSLHYLGHSQGTTQFFVFASQRPEYQNKIVSMHALSPVAFLRRLTNAVVKLGAVFVEPLEILANSLGIYDFHFVFQVIHAVGPELISMGELEPIIENLYYIFLGRDEPQFNITAIPTYLGHTPSGAATKQLYHYAQLLKSGKFRKYDYGMFKNLEMYKSVSPPEYNISAINVPIAFYYGLNDNMVHYDDAKAFIKMIPNPIEVYEIPYSKFNHLDFIIATDVKVLLYNKIFEVLQRFD